MKVAQFMHVQASAAGDGVQRVHDAATVNAIANHPEVRTFDVAGDVDAAALLANQRNVCLMGPHGGGLFIWAGDGVFEGHSLFLPTCRGADAIRVARLCCAMMFGQYGAKQIIGRTPVRLRAARWFNRQVGFRSLGVDGDFEAFVMEAPHGH